MKIVNIHEAKTQLSRLVEDVASGEEVLIAKAGKPMARLVAIATARGPRALGALAGRVAEASGCWEPDTELEALFYGGALEPAPAGRVAEKPVKRKRRRK